MTVEAVPLTSLSHGAGCACKIGPGDLQAPLAEILRGGAEIAAEAGVALLGGHSIDDPEPKYGLSVTGVAHPERIVRNSTGRPGDALFLTKPIGGGAVTTA